MNPIGLNWCLSYYENSFHIKITLKYKYICINDDIKLITIMSHSNKTVQQQIGKNYASEINNQIKYYSIYCNWQNSAYNLSSSTSTAGQHF